MVTDLQVRLMRRKLHEGQSQEGAAAAAGMSVRSARQWQRGRLPSQVDQPRHWRTRKDPFAGVWDREVVPLLEVDKDGELEATTILDFLDERHPGRFIPAQLRTLQRRMRDWRALYGPPQEVMFEQEHPPGREGAFDFTDCRELGVTIGGVAFAWTLYRESDLNRLERLAMLATPLGLVLALLKATAAIGSQS